MVVRLLTADELVEMYEPNAPCASLSTSGLSASSGRVGWGPIRRCPVRRPHRSAAPTRWPTTTGSSPATANTASGLVRGLSLERTLLYWMGHEQGNYMPEDVNIFSVAVPIATQIPHATGAAWASKLQGRRRPSSATSVTGPRQRATSTRAELRRRLRHAERVLL